MQGQLDYERQLNDHLYLQVRRQPGPMMQQGEIGTGREHVLPREDGVCEQLIMWQVYIIRTREVQACSASLNSGFVVGRKLG